VNNAGVPGTIIDGDALRASGVGKVTSHFLNFLAFVTLEYEKIACSPVKRIALHERWNWNFQICYSPHTLGGQASDFRISLFFFLKKVITLPWRW